MTKVVRRTACGLWAVAGVTPAGWANFSWVTEVTDDPTTERDDLDALSFIQSELLTTTAATGVAFATLHEGDAVRTANTRLDTADPEVTEDEVESWGPMIDVTVFTVCGVLEDTWRTICWRQEAQHAVAAYLHAWRALLDETGERLLLAAVHPGWYEAIPVFGLADPWAKTDDEVRYAAGRCFAL